MRIPFIPPPVNIEPPARPAGPENTAPTVTQFINNQTEAGQINTQLEPIGECITCSTRLYQDDSTDGGVSFQAATHISPEAAPALVRSHEMEHQMRDSMAAELEGCDVVLQYIQLHTSLCPECNRVYVSGGTSTTQTRGPVNGTPLSMESALLNMMAPPEDEDDYA